MATLYGANYTKAQLNNPPTLIHQGENNGRVKVAIDSFKGAVGLNDVIKMMTLPKGAKVLEAVLNHASLGAAGLYKAGFEGSIYLKGNDGSVSSVVSDATGYLVTHATKNAAICKAMTTIAGSGAQFARLCDANGSETVDGQVILTCTEAPTNANVEVTLAIYYVID